MGEVYSKQPTAGSAAQEGMPRATNVPSSAFYDPMPAGYTDWPPANNSDAAGGYVDQASRNTDAAAAYASRARDTSGISDGMPDGNVDVYSQRPGQAAVATYPQVTSKQEQTSASAATYTSHHKAKHPVQSKGKGEKHKHKHKSQGKGVLPNAATAVAAGASTLAAAAHAAAKLAFPAVAPAMAPLRAPAPAPSRAGLAGAAPLSPPGPAMSLEAVPVPAPGRSALYVPAPAVGTVAATATHPPAMLPGSASIRSSDRSGEWDLESSAGVVGGGGYGG